ncbi:hypothetical protein LOTGIDRAFT_165259 [Lottia gigantea]|uniref:EGF-like domain-containing protein n=1 Tax=Lottia gigantea TaxID=225164 RepID=V4BJX6_LOTGI|nr:hypothetical protein LOTGIDRAFT_165259 [Lottia gigantea]ESO88839.1 hypothetical protein LOTGIDRAFT_165259 [Lottia gigantea]
MKVLLVLDICCLIGLVSVGEAVCPDNCNYNGVCDVKHSRCNCYEGFTGSDCKTDCRCNGHGTCQSGSVCKCDEGWKYSGGQCVWDCHCLNGAKCIGPGECGCVHNCKMGNCRNGQCQCWNGYKGSDCSEYDPTM